MARIYVASSWRNKYQPQVCADLLAQGHLIYDFRNPPNKAGFKWGQIDKEWESWTPAENREKLLSHPDAAAGYLADFRAMCWADTCVLVLPCGRSAHLEAGWFAGANKRLIIYVPEKQEPELMYLMANEICTTWPDVVARLGGY